MSLDEMIKGGKREKVGGASQHLEIGQIPKEEPAKETEGAGKEEKNI